VVQSWQTAGSGCGCESWVSVPYCIFASLKISKCFGCKPNGKINKWTIRAFLAAIFVVEQNWYISGM
jgi:hypothetical protein